MQADKINHQTWLLSDPSSPYPWIPEQAKHGQAESRLTDLINTQLQAASSWGPTAGREAVPQGVGVDMVEVAEFEHLRYERNARFYTRCFSDEERAYCFSQAAPAEHFAARFAAKEAAVKALSRFVRLAYWQVEVIRRDDGSPELLFWDYDCREPLAEMKRFNVLVSLSHTGSSAIAVVIVYRKA